jgi:cytochrome c oxidase subunit 2
MTDIVSPPAHNDGADPGERVEHRWATVMVAVLVLLVAIATFAGLYHGAMPQARVETVDPRNLHLDGEFIESNLGSALEPDGSVMVRAIGQQYSWMALAVPVGTLSSVGIAAL